jgi:hypothetical protein
MSLQGDLSPSNLSAEEPNVAKHGGAVDSNGLPRSAPRTGPKSRAEKTAAERARRKAKSDTAIEPMYRKWYNENREARDLPSKFSVYVESLLERDQQLSAPGPEEAADPESVAGLEDALKRHNARSTANTRVNCEFPPLVLIAACLS